MRFSEYRSLYSELQSLNSLLSEIPEEDVLDRYGLEIRSREITRKLDSAVGLIELRDRAKAILTFKGRPVVGTHGIFADFGMKAVNSFSDAVAAVAASLSKPLKAMGPIPNRDQHQLLITDKAIGSFGFVLEEHGNANLLPNESTAVELAIEKVQDLLLATTSGDDDRLADNADELDQRAIDKVRDFIRTLADNEALCTIKFGAKVFSFKDSASVDSSLERISKDNLQEDDEMFEGTILGVLPNRRTFEFRVADDARVIVGKIGKAVADPSLLNVLIGELIRMRVSVTRVRGGNPRYVLRAVVGEDI